MYFVPPSKSVRTAAGRYQFLCRQYTITSHTKIKHTPISIQKAFGWWERGRATFMPYALTTSVGTIIQIVMTFNF